MEKVIRDGKVAVLISPGFGAGWYTWNNDKQLLFHPKLVEMVEAGKQSEIDEEWCCKNISIPDVYCGGASDLVVRWIDEGAAFTVEDYDGNESLRLIDDLTIIA